MLQMLMNALIEYALLLVANWGLRYYLMPADLWKLWKAVLNLWGGRGVRL